MHLKSNRSAPGRKAGLILSGLLLTVVLLSTGSCGKSTSADGTPPGRVMGVIAAVSGGTIKVFWSPSQAKDFSHFLLYMGTSTDSMSTTGEEISVTSKFFNDLTIGTTFYFYVTAVDDAGNESEPSTIVNGTPTSAEWETSLGWDAFGSDDYVAAITLFQSALQLDDSHAEAHLGIGWSEAMRGDLPDARFSLRTANTLGLTSQDANAGLAVVYRDLPDLAAAISKATTVIQNNPAYSFSYRSSIDYMDMHLVMAQCYFRLGEYYFEQAQAQVDILDPTNGLDPTDPGSWSVGGVMYDSYGIALLRKIMELEVSIGG